MNDPRFEWLDTRVGLPGAAAGALPGPGGVPQPFNFFSQRMQHWDQFYTRPIQGILSSALRTTEHGLNGYIVAFEPGPWVGSSSYYGDEIPLPVDILPYCLMGLAYREATWNPGINLVDFRRVVHRRYFSSDAPARFAEDMLSLHQFSLHHWAVLRLFGKYGKPKADADGKKLEPTIAGQLQNIEAITDEKQKKAEAATLLAQLRELDALPAELTKLTEMERAMQDVLPHATAKTRAGFAILQRMIDDTRALYAEAVPSQAKLTDAIRKAGVAH